MKRLLLPLLVAIGLLSVHGGITAAQAAGLSVPVTGKVSGIYGNGIFDGTVTLKEFAFPDSRFGLTGVGLLNGTVTVNGQKATLTNVPVAVPTTLTSQGGAGKANAAPQNAQGQQAALTCQVLTLDIGAIHLDLLGLVVDLAPVMLNVTALPGGGLLGNLLCSLSGLLSGVSSLLDFTNLLSILTQVNAVLASL